MRWIPLILAALILLLQYPLWFGKGGWLRVWELGHEVETQKRAYQKAHERNSVMDAEVRDLKQGNDAIEERARSGLGMIKPGEIFFQVDEDTVSRLPAASQVVSSAPQATEKSAGVK